MKRKIDFITITACGMVVLLLSVMFFAIPDKDISQKENRSLSQIPVFSADSLLSGKYTSDLAEYISDQFPARDIFVAVKAYSELCLGKRENNGVIYAKNNTLISRDEIAQNRLQENIDTVKEFEAATGVPVCLSVLPRTVDVFSEYLPDTYPKEKDSAIWNDFFNMTNSAGVTAPNLYKPLCSENRYYRTDHHYSVYGAYQTYQLLGDELGYEPKGDNFFSVQTATEDFCGTAMRTSAFYLAKKDTITLFRYDGDGDYAVTADGKNIPLYDMSKLESADKYAVFLGGNHARVDVVSNGETRPKLLVIRDSFADSLAPFLAIHFDLVMIDLRYYSDSVQQIVKSEDIDKVLILESMSEFATNNNISYLRRPSDD